MSSRQTIAIDVMGGDFGPRLCISAAKKFLRDFPQYQLILVGNQSALDEFAACALPSNIDCLFASQVVSTSDRAGSALRHKRDSSMWRALELVRDGKADACVSGGNTGALMAMSRYLIGTLANMSRPAICKPIPTRLGGSLLLDMGANLNCRPSQLLQFARMGTALAKVNGVQNPSVALINVGAETTKGHQEIREAHSLMAEDISLNFAGFVEGNQLYDGVVDVVVCDGFVGNVTLKVSEGAAKFIVQSLKQEFSSGIARRLLGLLNAVALKKWRERFNPSKYNGAALLGLKKTVIKSHGGATAEGYYYALVTAKQQLEAGIPEKLNNVLEPVNTI